MRIWENETQCLDFGPFLGTKGQAFLTRDAFPYEGFISILNRWEINGKIVSTKLFELWEGGLLRMLWNNILMFFFGGKCSYKKFINTFFHMIENKNEVLIFIANEVLKWLYPCLHILP